MLFKVRDALPRVDHRLARGQFLEAAQGLHPDREGFFTQHVNNAARSEKLLFVALQWLSSNEGEIVNNC